MFVLGNPVVTLCSSIISKSYLDNSVAALLLYCLNVAFFYDLHHSVCHCRTASIMYDWANIFFIFTNLSVHEAIWDIIVNFCHCGKFNLACAGVCDEHCDQC